MGMKTDHWNTSCGIALYNIDACSSFRLHALLYHLIYVCSNINFDHFLCMSHNSFALSVVH
jgi:hypothetical protein